MQASCRSAGQQALVMAIFLTVEHLAYVVVFQGVLSFIQVMAILAWVLLFYEICANAINHPPSCGAC